MSQEVYLKTMEENTNSKHSKSHNDKNEFVFSAILMAFGALIIMEALAFPGKILGYIWQSSEKKE